MALRKLQLFFSFSICLSLCVPLAHTRTNNFFFFHYLRFCAHTAHWLTTIPTMWVFFSLLILLLLAVASFNFIHLCDAMHFLHFSTIISGFCDKYVVDDAIPIHRRLFNLNLFCSMFRNPKLCMRCACFMFSILGDWVDWIEDTEDVERWLSSVYSRHS